MKNFSKEVQANLEKMCATGKLFRSSVTGQQVWDSYISGFEPEENPIFRDPNSSTHNCNLCNNFIRRYGNIVAIDVNFKIITLFDNITGVYAKTSTTISEMLKNAVISDVFFETYAELNYLPYEKINKTQEKYLLGIAHNVKQYNKAEAELYGVVKEGEIRKFDHLHMFLPKMFVDQSGNSIEKIMADFRDAKNVFQRAMEEIPLDTLHLVRDLINQESLLDGKTHLFKIEAIIPKKLMYDQLSASERDNWLWIHSYKLPFAKFRNELIGTLCVELAEGKELNEACKTWNYRVDPINYMKATAPITKKQIEDAKKFVEENSYEESFNRRFATIDDIKASEILHVNTGNGELKTVSIFDSVKSTSTRHKRSEFDKIEEVTIEKFMSDILPNCTSVEAFLTNNQEGNLVSLTTANVKESKPIFKWNNNYSWTFAGNIAGKSQIKDAVKSRGGKTEAVVRISLAFPGTTDDYDLHCIEPNKNHIYFGNKRTLHASSGMIDLDAQGGDGHFPPEKRVENITYSDLSKMPNGNYEIQVNNYSGRGLHTKFQLEVEIEGDVTLVELDKTTRSNTITIGTLTKQNNQVIFTPKNATVISSETISKEIYGLETNKFHKVNLVCLSPNHWDNNNVGNKHYFFMLDNCKCPTAIRSFHIENLIPELAIHRKVLEVLGNTTMINPTNKQLSGLGFNATVRDELIVRLSGTHKRVIKIKF
jgi:hypothetical protein